MSPSVGRLEKIWYRVFGSTTAHIQHEFFLSASLLLLTISSLQALYKGSFGTVGDIKYVLLASLWLGRYCLLRWLCCADVSTHKSPTLGGMLVHWISSHVVAGQYFDRPSPQMLARQTGNNYNDGTQSPVTFSSFLSPSVLYAIHLFKVRIGFPLLALREGFLSKSPISGKRGGRSAKHSERRNQIRDNDSSGQSRLSQVFSLWTRLWGLNGPTLHFVVVASSVLFYAWYFFIKGDTVQSTNSLTNSRDYVSMEEGVPYGAYRVFGTPRTSDTLFYLSSVGTLLSIVLYGRLLLPIPDLVAGTNVLKAVRNEAKAFGKSTKTRTQRENTEYPWAEQYKSIINENRFRLICKVAVLRLLENLFVCMILPRTGAVCRYVGHCSLHLSVTEMAKIFFPVGVNSKLRQDFNSTGGAYMTPDNWAVFLCAVSVVVISLCCLLAQAATLNRSYLGIMGYVVGGWTVVDGSDVAVSGAPHWDPRRRYKKGDVIVQNYPGFGGSFVYKATSNSPEGRPFDLYLRASHDLFRNELGHPATSEIIAFLSGVQIFLVLVTIFSILVYQIMDYGYGSLLCTLAANLIAAYGMLSATLNRYGEIEDIAQSIAQ